MRVMSAGSIPVIEAAFRFERFRSLMKASPNWASFERNINRAFTIFEDQMPLPIEEEYGLSMSRKRKECYARYFILNKRP